VREQVWVVDPVTGDLVVEGLDAEESLALAGDLLLNPTDLNCARPLRVVPLPVAATRDVPTLRVAAIWHGSVVEGPGRRSVVQLQGCTIRCIGCAVPQTHAMQGSVLVSVDDVADALLDPVGAPRDGVTVIGGEPMAQLAGLTALLRRLKASDTHIVVYTGFTLEALARRRAPAVGQALQWADLLIDGPYIPALADGAGEWRGSRNQRLIQNPASALTHVLAAQQSRSQRSVPGTRSSRP
jgi:anaerobic ribonucleoside-triphosphate reductase activating protein